MRLLELVSLPEHDFFCGLLFIQGAGYRIGVVSDGQTHHMSAAAARRLAREYEDEPEVAEELAPVCEALRATADKLDQYGLAGAEPEGRA